MTYIRRFSYTGQPHLKVIGILLLQSVLTRPAGHQIYLFFFLSKLVILKMPQQNTRRAQLAVLAGALIVETVSILAILCQFRLRECPTPIDHPVHAESPCQFSGTFDLSENECNVTVCQSEDVYGGVLVLGLIAIVMAAARREG